MLGELKQAVMVKISLKQSNFVDESITLESWGSSGNSAIFYPS